MLLWPKSDKPEPSNDNSAVKARELETAETEARTLAESLFNVQMLDTETETVSDNLIDWKITSLTPREMRIALTFAKPLEVSHGDEVDSLVIFAGLGDYTDN